ncbi:MMPL family transporter [Ideonella sp. DXS29W]|uniref:MMPL family transporter n=1 Tax=Ideonella lacteola TaxID=2984193 RepID=A0ABU9BSP4_9BURK
MQGWLPGAQRRAAWALGLWLIAMLWGVWVVTRSHFTADMSAFLPASPNAAQQVLIEQIQRGAPARTVLIGISGGDEAARAQASMALARALRASGLFEQVQNGERGDWAASARWLVDRRYLLSPAVVPQRFGADGLAEAIDDTLSLLGTPAGAVVKPLLQRDPTGETQHIVENLIPARAPKVADGVWMSREAPRAVLLASALAAGSDLDAQAHMLQRIRDEFVPWAKDGLTLQLSGAPVFAVQSRAQIEHEVHWLSAWCTLLVGGLLWVAFASGRALLAAALPVLAGVMAGVVAVSLGFGTVHGMTLGFGSTLIGEAVDYAIYYLIQAHAGVAAGDPHGQGWRRWLRSSWPTVKLGLLTSLCGFAALTFSGFPGLAQLGVFSMAGLVAATVTARWVLPALLPDGAAAQGWRISLGRWTAAAMPQWRRSRWWWLGLSMAAALVLWRAPEPLWRGDLTALSPVSPAALALDAELRSDLSADDGGWLVLVRGDGEEQALQRAEAATEVLDRWIDEGRLLGYDSPTRVLPSVSTQAQRQASLPEPVALRQAVERATRDSPLSASSLNAFLSDVESARQAAPVRRADLNGTAFAPMVNAMLLDRDDGSVTALITVHPASGQTLEGAALQQALSGVPGAHVLALKQELDGLYQGYLHEAMWQSSLGALAVVALLGLWLRSVSRLIRVAMPLALAVVLCLAGLHLSGAALGVLHLVGLLLVVALGSNYALFFDSPGGGPDGQALDASALSSLCLANLTAVLSFGLIACSEIPALSAIGQVVAPGALLALLISAAFAKPGSAPSSDG